MAWELNELQERMLRTSHQKYLMAGDLAGNEMVRTRDAAGFDLIKYLASVVSGLGAVAYCSGDLENFNGD